MPKAIPIEEEIGKRYGRLVVIGQTEKDKYGHKVFCCTCECGSTHFATAVNIKSGRTSSCGCLKSELRIRLNTTHGDTIGGKQTSEYQIYTKILQRCMNPNDRGYHRYGARGITVSHSWAASFSAFIFDMGQRPSQFHSIERIDNNKGYSKENCKWATRAEQNNNKRNNVILTWNGQSKTMSQWANELGVNYKSMRKWIRVKGLSIEECIEKSNRTRGSSGVHRLA